MSRTCQAGLNGNAGRNLSLSDFWNKDKHIIEVGKHIKE